MDDDAIRLAYVKGHSPAAIAKLAGRTAEAVQAVLDIKEEEPAPEFPEYTPEALEAIASEALYKLACAVHQAPTAFKPSEAIAILRESLDRTRGRAAQTLHVDTKATVTHEHIMSLPPAEAYRLMIMGNVDVIDEKR